jgi:single-strand DNA-binding protein
LQTRSWDDRDGQKRYTTEVLADRIQLLGGASRTAAASEGDYGTPEPAPAGGGMADDDIPF